MFEFYCKKLLTNKKVYAKLRNAQILIAMDLCEKNYKIRITEEFFIDYRLK